MANYSCKGRGVVRFAHKLKFLKTHKRRSKKFLSWCFTHNTQFLHTSTSHLSLFWSHSPPHSFVRREIPHTRKLLSCYQGKCWMSSGGVTGREGGREEGPFNGGKVGEGSLVRPCWKKLAFFVPRKFSNNDGEERRNLRFALERKEGVDKKV